MRSRHGMRTRLTLTTPPEPQDAARSESREVPPKSGVPGGAAAGKSPPGGEAPPPGFGEAVGGARAAFVRLARAHGLDGEAAVYALKGP